MVKSTETAGAERLAHLKGEHRALELRLAELEGHLSLSPEEQMERARIKKLKLAMKDEMARLERAHR